MSFFIIGDWNAKVGSQEAPGVTGKFDSGEWNEAGQRLIEFCKENTLVIANTFFQQHTQNKAGQRLTEFCQENALVIANILVQQHKRRLYTCSPMVNTKIRLIISFAAKDGEALYSQQNKTGS